jgi:hypothetical protein
MTDNTRTFLSILILILFMCAGELYSWRTFNRAALGSDANGVGGAYVGDASSEFAIYYNPAGMVQLSSNLSFTYEISSRVRIADFLNWNVTVAFDYFPFFALSGSLNEWKWGVSVTTLFDSVVNKSSMSVRSINFTAAYPVLPNLSVGAGVGPVIASENTGYGFSYAYNIGLLWKVTEDLQLGLCFHSPVDLAWSITEKGGSLFETFPFLIDLGGMFRLNEKMFLFGSLEYVSIDTIRYVLDNIDYSPAFDGNLFGRLHPHFGLQFLEENTGAHISLGVLLDSSYYDTGSINQFRFTAGVRAYGKNLVFRASLIDSLLFGLFYRYNDHEEEINLSFSFRI